MSKERNSDLRSALSFFGTFDLERIDLYPYTSFDGDVGFTVRDAASDRTIHVHLTTADAREFAEAIIDVCERHKAATKQPFWKSWRFRESRKFKNG